MKMRKFLFLIAVVSLVVACEKEKCDYNECEFKAPAAEIQAVQNYLASQNITNAQQHCSGVFYVIDTLGTGKHPNSCSQVAVSYKGRLTNGAIFDEDTTAFGLGRVIVGWRNTIPLLRAGGSIRMYIPPTLGYGGKQQSNIPPNSILVFDVKLHDVQ